MPDAPTTPTTETHDDPWQRVLRAAEGDLGDVEAPRRGRVLSVKLGYNPNSSSVGSVISVLMWTATFGAIALNIVTAIVARDARRPGLPPGDEDA